MTAAGTGNRTSLATSAQNIRLEAGDFAIKLFQLLSRGGVVGGATNWLRDGPDIESNYRDNLLNRTQRVVVETTHFFMNTVHILQRIEYSIFIKPF